MASFPTDIPEGERNKKILLLSFKNVRHNAKLIYNKLETIKVGDNSQLMFEVGN